MNLKAILLGLVFCVLGWFVGGFIAEPINAVLPNSPVIAAVFIVIFALTGYFVATKSEKRELVNVITYGIIAYFLMFNLVGDYKDSYSGERLAVLLLLPSVIIGGLVYIFKEKRRIKRNADM